MAPEAYIVHVPMTNHCSKALYARKALSIKTGSLFSCESLGDVSSLCMPNAGFHSVGKDGMGLHET